MGACASLLARLLACLAQNDGCLPAPQVHELGRGQFGRVWLAHWKGVEVAVKELHRGGDATARAEMLREAQTLAGLRHPCVIALFGILLDESSVGPMQVDLLKLHQYTEMKIICRSVGACFDVYYEECV